jgi:hypothetical protein
MRPSAVSKQILCGNEQGEEGREKVHKAGKDFVVIWVMTPPLNLAQVKTYQSHTSWSWEDFWLWEQIGPTMTHGNHVSIKPVIQPTTHGNLVDECCVRLDYTYSTTNSSVIISMCNNISVLLDNVTNLLASLMNLSEQK